MARVGPAPGESDEVVLIDAAGIIGARLFAMYEATHKFIRGAPERGMTEYEAFLIDLRANAFERLRLSSILPCLPDNDWLDDQVRQSQGLPSERECSLPGFA